MIVGVAIGTPASLLNAVRVVGPPFMLPQDGRAHRPRDGSVDALGPATQRPDAGKLVRRATVGGVASLRSVRPVGGCLGVDG